MSRIHIPTSDDILKRHVEKYIIIFENALLLLAQSSVSKKENEINFKLAIMLRKACFNWKAERGEELAIPKYEQPSQPTGEECEIQVHPKRPDFTSSFINAEAKSAKEFELYFPIECKVLGIKETSWDYCKNYSNNGINRFISSSHKYGKNFPYGLMIGYMVDISKDEALVLVNTQIEQTAKTPCLQFYQSETGGTSFKCDQPLIRNFSPKKFLLFHLWTDLQTAYQDYLTSNIS